MAVGRRWLITCLPLATLVAPLAAAAQQQGKMYRLGILVIDRPQRAEFFKQVYSKRLSELGWHDGRNLGIDLRSTDSADRAAELAASLVAVNPHVLVAIGPYAAHSVKEATRTIPTVFAAVADPVGRGLVTSLARPGGNITGVSHLVGTGRGHKSAQLLKECVPNAQRIAMLINPANPFFGTSETLPEDRRLHVRELALTINYVEARTIDDISPALDAAARSRADAVIIAPDSVFSAARETIISLVAKHKLPAVYPDRAYVQAGGLLSYSTDFIALFRRSADYVDKIFRGTRPSDLPIEQPTKFELAINLQTAKALGLTIPRSLLLRADHVIE